MMHILQIALLLAGVCVEAPAWAQNTEQQPTDTTAQRARELYDNGKRLYDEGQYENAILAWEEGYRLSKKALFLSNIGGAYERLGDLERAVTYLDQYRAFAPADEQIALQRRIAAIEQRLTQRQPGAQPEPADRTNTDEDTTTPLPDTLAAPPASTEAGRSSATVSLSLLGSGGVALAIGSVFALQAKAAHTNALEHCSQGEAGDVMCSTAAQPYIDKELRTALAADVGFAVGAIGLAAGLVVTFTGSDVPLTPLLLPGGGGLSLGGRL